MLRFYFEVLLEYSKQVQQLDKMLSRYSFEPEHRSRLRDVLAWKIFETCYDDWFRNQYQLMLPTTECWRKEI